MSLSRSPLDAKLQSIESRSSLAIETEHTSRLVTDAEEELISKQRTLPNTPENSHEEALINFNPSFLSSPAIAGTGSAIHDSAASPHPFATPHINRPYSPVASAVDSTTDAPELCFERRLTLSEVNFSHQGPFRTPVRDSVEANCLAGYEKMAPETATIPLPTLATSETSSVKPTARDQPPSYSKLPRLRSGAPAYEMVNRIISSPIDQTSHRNESSPAVITTPETPIFGRWPDESDFSFDGMSVGMKNRDTADNLAQNTTDYEEISPTSFTPPESDRRALDEIAETPENESSDQDVNITRTSANDNNDRNNDEGNSIPVMEIEPTSSEANDPAHATVPEVPGDITDQLPSPRLHPPSQSDSKLGKRKRMFGGAQKLYRKARSVVVRRRVLNVIIGRQLGKPTRDGLRGISKGLPVFIVVEVMVSEPDSPR